MSAAEISIQQALHGYEDGHRLLGGSTPIAAADRRRMLTMSDSPDAGGLGGERSLLMGYPLPSGEFYVLAKTWAAPEVKRPGCVWTHSLLLDERSLAIADPRACLGLFRRPRSVAAASGYERPLRTKSSATAGGQEMPVAAETILWTLYQEPPAPVDLRRDALEGIQSQAFLLALWGQQWPGLRRTFSFAEAPRVGRRLDGRLLDLQVTERPQKGSWEPEGDPAPPRTVVKPVRETPRWSAALAVDLANPGPLRRFLWKWGEALEGSRTALWALASLSVATDADSEVNPAALAIDLLSRAFPRREQARELKESVLSGNRDSAPPTLADRDLLTAVVESGAPEALAAVDLQLRKRAKRLVSADPTAALEVAEAVPARVDHDRREIAEGIAAGLGKAEISKWSRQDPTSLAKLVNRSEGLAGLSLLWGAVDYESFWPLVRNPRAARERRRAMLRGMLAAHEGDFVEAAFEAWPDATEVYVTLLAQGEGTWRSSRYLAAAEDKAVLRWLRLNGPCPELVRRLLRAWEPRRLKRLPAKEWAAFWEQASGLEDRDLALFLIAAGDPETRLGPERALAVFQALVGRGELKKKALEALQGAAGERLGAADAAALLLSRGFRAPGWRPSSLLELDDARLLSRVLEADDSGELVGELVGELGDRELPAAQSAVIYEIAIRTDNRGTLRKIIEAGRDFIPWL